MHRVEWRAAAANRPSVDAARRLGMTRDGVRREAPYRGARQDMEVWSVLAPEWRAARAADGACRTQGSSSGLSDGVRTARGTGTKTVDETGVKTEDRRTRRPGPQVGTEAAEATRRRTPPGRPRGRGRTRRTGRPEDAGVGAGARRRGRRRPRRRSGCGRGRLRRAGHRLADRRLGGHGGRRARVAGRPAGDGRVAGVGTLVEEGYGDAWQATAMWGGVFALAALVVGVVVLARPAFGAPGRPRAPWRVLPTPASPPSSSACGSPPAEDARAASAPAARASASFSVSSSPVRPTNTGLTDLVSTDPSIARGYDSGAPVFVGWTGWRREAVCRGAGGDGGAGRPCGRRPRLPRSRGPGEPGPARSRVWLSGSAPRAGFRGGRRGGPGAPRGPAGPRRRGGPGRRERSWWSSVSYMVVSLGSSVSASLVPRCLNLRLQGGCGHIG
ncbi:hypothetical protein STENM223S_01782 [Streptomyces tendae]